LSAKKKENRFTTMLKLAKNRIRLVIESDLKNKYSNEVLNNITNESDQSMQEETARLILQ
jgi:hypothetical protein